MDQSVKSVLDDSVSIISIPLQIPVKELRLVINEKLPQVLLEELPIKFGLQMTVVRNGAVKINTEGRVINWEVPVAVHVFGNKEEWTSLYSTFTVFFQSKFEITPDWHVVTETIYKSVDWKDKPSLNLGFFDISLGTVATKAIRKNRETITDKVDALIYEQVNLKELVEDLWKKIQNPILISGEKDGIYGHLRPNHLVIYNYAFSAEFLELSAGINTRIYTTMADEEMTIPATELHNLRLSQNEKTRSKIFIPFFIPSAELSRIISKKLNGFEFQNEEETYKLKDIDVSTDERKVIVSGAVTGGYKFKFKVVGTPRYLKKSMAVTFGETEFSVETKNLMLKIGVGVFKKKLLEKIKGKARLDLRHLHDMLPELIQSGFENSQKTKSLAIRELSVNAEPVVFTLTDQGLSFLIKVQAKTALEVTDIKLDN